MNHNRHIGHNRNTKYFTLRREGAKPFSYCVLLCLLWFNKKKYHEKTYHFDHLPGFRNLLPGMLRFPFSSWSFAHDSPRGTPGRQGLLSLCPPRWPYDQTPQLLIPFKVVSFHNLSVALPLGRGGFLPRKKNQL